MEMAFGRTAIAKEPSSLPVNERKKIFLLGKKTT